jgi:DNA helicase-2/ATP-dependent DNA helicase PcrA
MTAELDVSNASPLLADLTPPQREAVMHVDGPLLIVAGAGSGKTRVITRRVSYLISKGISPSSILGITFTNKAAGEMKQRVSDALGRRMYDFGRLDQPWPILCTFHSLCLRILRHYGARIGLPEHFSIFDAADQTRLMKEALKSLEMSATNFTPSAVHGTISNAKNQLLSPQAYAGSATGFYERQVARIYAKYQELLAQNNALDFDDLLVRATDALRDHPDVLKELQDRFRYVMIDEYQDTNHAQYILAHALALTHRNICVVGDPDQSIYAWRGADVQNILDFEKDYPDAEVVRLEQNYRSTKTILRIASALIAHNTQRKEKTLWTENDEGVKAQVLLCQDEYDEADTVMRQLKSLGRDEGGGEASAASGPKGSFVWSDMAIFYRINALSRVMEDALRRAGVPYQIARGVEFYNRKEIKDVLAYLRVVANPADRVSLERIVNVPPRGLGSVALKRIEAHAIANGIPPLSAMQEAEQMTGLSTRAAGAAKRLSELVQSWRAMAIAQSEPGVGRVQRVMEAVVKQSGLEVALAKAGGEEQEQIANVNELINSAAEFDEANPEGSLDDYLSAISLVSDIDHLKGAGGAVTLMTLHAAKGLEFPVVAIIGMEEGILPHSRARGSTTELEEERRLCFVGITRAQQRLILSKAAYRSMRGIRERTITSPFLTEFPAESIEVIDRTGIEGIDSASGESGYPDMSAAQFRRGQMVRHPTFGVGRIEQIGEGGQHTRAVIEFKRVGRKTLILEYANLEAVG